MKFKQIKFIALFTIIALVSSQNTIRKLQEENKQIPDLHKRSKSQENEFFEKYKEVYAKLLEEKTQEDEQTRKLQTQNISQIRITADTSKVKNLYLFTQEQIDYMLKLIDLSIDFVQKLIKVESLTKNNMPNLYGTKCYDYQVPSQDIQNGIPNSDFHIYFNAINDPSESFVANSIWCSFDQTFMRPNFGRVDLNLVKYFGSKAGDVDFFEDVATNIHELIHMLGFSTSLFPYWKNPKTGKYYDSETSDFILVEKIRGLDTQILTSKNIVEVSRKYYGCDSMKGMQLENEGSGTHWERTIVYAEILSASTMNVSEKLSIFTVALLKDTGFWADVNDNMAEDHFWGKNKGCDFIDNACNSLTNYREFDFSNRSKIKCSFYYDGAGYTYNDEYSDTCGYIKPITGRMCDDGSLPGENAEHFINKDAYYESYSYDSRCFESNLFNPQSTIERTDDLRCHKSACSEDKNTIFIYLPQIKDFKVECSINESGKIKEVYNKDRLLGTIKCPEDFEVFCGNRNCPNNCSKNGYCIRGQCDCVDGYTGQDCSLKCPLNQVNHNSKCVTQCPNGFYKNPDNTCKQTCPDGYYPNNNVCSLCDFSCSKCNGPKSNNCTACQFTTILEGNTCVKTCSQGYQLNEQKKLCQPVQVQQCPQGCKQCDNNQNCKICEQGYMIKGSKCEKINICPDSQCQICDQKNTSECTQCNSGFYLNKITKRCVKKDECPSKTFANTQINECTSCHNGCEQCISDTQCVKCDEKNNYKLDKNICILCNQNCKTCLASNQDACTSCENNLYLFESKCVSDCPQRMFKDNNKICQNCSKGCLSCKNQQQCDSCDLQAGYKSFENICINAVDCISPCKTCGPYEPKTCTSCAENYYLQGTTCVSRCNSGFFADQKTQSCIQCDKNCSSCESEANQCTICNSSQVLHDKKCVDSCPQKYSNISGKCIQQQDEAAKENEQKDTFSNLLNNKIIQLLLISIILI